MTLLKHNIQEHLTEPNAELARAARASHPGMAHFAGTGPRGMTCRECIHWQHQPYDYHSKTGKHHGLIKPATCAKYKALMGEKGKAVPDFADACRHFEWNVSHPRRFA